MPPSTPVPRASLLLVEECFAKEDDGFVEALRQVESPKLLAAFSDRWKKDLRPWARAQILAYLELPLDCPGHQPLVKHLFKDAEERRDDELMAAFLVAFDTLVRRVRTTRWRWNQEERTSYTEEYLKQPRDVLPRDPEQSYLHAKTGQRVVVSQSGRRVTDGRLFTYRTRHYLRRRAWRYFRWLGYGRPADFPPAIARALRRYRDADLEKGENILDSRGLLQVCFYGSPVLTFTPRHVRLNEGRTLAELKAAPRFAPAWNTPAAATVLLELVAQAQAQLVRLWAMEWYRETHLIAAGEIPADTLLALLDHADERVQLFGSELFAAQPNLATWPLTTWLRVLQVRNLTALATLCASFRQHVAAERLTLDQVVALTTSQPAPVARLGLSLLETRAIAVSEYAVLGALADARCQVIAGELATWALARLGKAEHYDLAVVSRFFDSLGVATREAAWNWLVEGAGGATSSAGYRDAVLWSRLAETPFEDLRLQLVDHLALRLKMPALSATDLAPVWSAVLLGVHRGGRQKAKAVRAVSEAIAAQPESASQLLPVLAVAVRSVRGPEMRAGLAAVMTLLAARPEMAETVRRHLPELEFAGLEVAA